MIFTHLFGNCLPDPVEGSRDTCIYSADALNTPSWNQDRKWAFLNLKKGCCEDGTPSCGLFKPPTEGPDGLMASLLHMSTSTTNCCSILLCAWIYYCKCIFVNIDIHSSVKLYTTTFNCLKLNYIVTIHFVGNKYFKQK